MYNFVTSRILETKVSGRLVAVACQGFVRANPKESMKLFMPHFCGTVLRLLQENEDSAKEERLDNELAYNMLILSEVNIDVLETYQGLTLVSTASRFVK